MPWRLHYTLKSLVAISAWFVLHLSIFGRRLFAVGKREEAAR